MTKEELRRQQDAMASGLALLIRRQLRDMRRRMTKPRLYRLPKEARVLKSVMAEARAAGLLPPQERRERRSRRGRSL